MIYTGIGARKTPKGIISTMLSVSRLLDRKGYTLRSGGADGADSAFEEGATLVKPEIYLPWPGFNGRTSIYTKPKPETFDIAKIYHPRWDKLSSAAQKFMARNVHQVLGWDLVTLSDFVVCWTNNGGAVGGTGQALRIARACNIPIYNLYNDEDVAILVGEVLNSKNDE